MAELFSNFAESTTTVAINNTTDPVTFTVQTGDGQLYPAAAVGGTDYFRGVLDTGSNREVVTCTRNGDSVTAVRAQEGTAKIAHNSGVAFKHEVTAASLANLPAYPQSSTLTTKGDLLVRGANNVVRQPVGTNGQVLVSDSTQTRGVRWGSATGSKPTGMVDLSDYAVSDGTDQRANIQAAVAAAGGTRGGMLWVPPLDYVIASPGIDSSGIPALTVMGPGFTNGQGAGNFLGGATFLSTGQNYTMWTHTGTGAANHQGITFENVKFADQNDNQKTLAAYNAATPGGSYSAGVITFKTTANHGYVVGDKVWVRNMWPKGYNGRWTVASVPTTTTFTVASSWDPGGQGWPGIYQLTDAYQGGFVAKEPSVTGLKIASETRWKVVRCGFAQMRVALNINAPGSTSADASWGHAEDNVFSQCDVGIYYNGPGNYSTNVSGGNLQLGDDQIGYWFSNGAHQKIGTLKVDTSMPNGQGKAIVGDRAIGILFEDNDAFSANSVDFEMESDSVCIACGTGTYTPSWAGNTGTSWTRTNGGTNYTDAGHGTNPVTTGGVTNTLAGTGSDYSGSIGQFGMQHNDSNDGRGIVLLGKGHVSILGPEFNGSGFATCIDIGGTCSGCSVIGGHDQIGNSSHKGVVIGSGVSNTDIVAFNRTNGGTAGNHISDSGTRTNLVAVHKTETAVATYVQA